MKNGNLAIARVGRRVLDCVCALILFSSFISTSFAASVPASYYYGSASQLFSTGDEVCIANVGSGWTFAYSEDIGSKVIKCWRKDSGNLTNPPYSYGPYAPTYFCSVGDFVSSSKTCVFTPPVCNPATSVLNASQTACVDKLSCPVKPGSTQWRWVPAGTGTANGGSIGGSAFNACSNGCIAIEMGCNSGAAGGVIGAAGQPLKYCQFKEGSSPCPDGVSPNIPVIVPVSASQASAAATSAAATSAAATSSGSGTSAASGTPSSGGGDPGNTGRDPSASCPECRCIEAGQGFGSVNGQTVCVPPANSPNPITTTSNSAGTVTSTNSSGGVTTQKSASTTCQNGTCNTTTTTTKTNAAGQSTTTTTNTSGDSPASSQNKGLCELNPDASACQEAGTWAGGDCGPNPPACTGDPVQCAQAREAWKTACKWYEMDKSNELSALAIGAKSKEFSQAQLDAALNKDGAKDQDVSAKFSQYRKDYFTFASSCTDHLSFSFKGQTYTFDLSAVCEIGKFLRLLMHLAAYMSVVALLSRTVPT